MHLVVGEIHERRQLDGVSADVVGDSRDLTHELRSIVGTRLYRRAVGVVEDRIEVALRAIDAVGGEGGLVPVERQQRDGARSAVIRCRSATLPP